MKKETFAMIVTILFFYFIGIATGMVCQQLITMNMIRVTGQSFSGMIENVNIDFNETQIVEGTTKIMKEFINNSINNTGEV